MTDLRQAAEKVLQENKPHGEFLEALDELRQALAQPEQEPVAWIHTRCGHPLYLSFQYHAEDVPLYTAPPNRKWVGLTRRELDIATLGLEDLGDCYKAIEAKLKEKNT